MSNFFARGLSAKWLVVVVGIIGILGICCIITIAYFHNILTASQTNSTSVSPQSNRPDIRVTDMAPQLPNSQKTAIVVMHSDSSYEKFILPNGAVAAYIKNLPEGDTVISQTSPAK